MNDIKSSSTTSEPAGDRLCGEDWRDFARWLLELSADPAIRRILQRLGQDHGADRAWLVRYNDAFTHFWSTHEWTAPEVPSFLEELQGIPVEMGAFLHEKLEQDQIVHLPDTRRMPRRAKAMQVEFQRQGIRSFLAVPVCRQGRLTLQIGFDAVNRLVSWGAPAERALREAGALIALRFAGGSDLALPATPAPLAHIHDGSAALAVAPSDILWIESDGDYSRVRLREGGSAMQLRSLSAWEQTLSREGFLRVHRTLIVNLGALHELTRARGVWKLQLRGTERLFPVGRQYRALLRRHLGF